LEWRVVPPGRFTLKAEHFEYQPSVSIRDLGKHLAAVAGFRG